MGIGLLFSPAALALCRARRYGARVEVETTAVVPLPAGALVPGLGRPNLADLAACGAALDEVLARARVSRAAVGVAIPDASVRIRALAEVPRGGTPGETRRLVAWQVRDGLPFAPEQARADYAALPAGAVCLVAAAPVVSQYEVFLRARRLVPVHLGAASLALWRLLAMAGPADGVVVLAEAPSATLLVASDGVPRAWRVLAAADPDTLTREIGDTVHALTESGALSARPRVLVHADPAVRDALVPALAAETDLEVADPRWPAGVPSDPALLPALGAALST